MRLLWRSLVARWAAWQIREARNDGYLDGLLTGRRERPMTCGLAAAEHCAHSYMYDPGQ